MVGRRCRLSARHSRLRGEQSRKFGILPGNPALAGCRPLRAGAGSASEPRELIFPDDALVPVALAFYTILKLVVGFGQQAHHLEARGSEHLLVAIGGKADTLPHGKFMG
jgi:hypothetical protein